jgi:hypothetical protein
MKCRSCQADVLFVPTKDGKQMPLDAPGEQRLVIEEGVAVVRLTYVSHFATCPEAEKWRKR